LLAAAAALAAGCSSTPGAARDVPQSAATRPAADATTPTHPRPPASLNKIVFSVDTSKATAKARTVTNIFVIDADGRNLHQLTRFRVGYAQFPSLSAARREVIFEYREDDEHSADIWAVGLDGRGLRNITDPNDADDEDDAGDWSPDGAEILYTSGRGGGYRIYRMHPDGFHIEPVGTDSGASWPAMSPDGSMIAYMACGVDRTRCRLFLMRADGAGRRQLVPEAVDGYRPAWSPDSTKIAYARHSGRTAADLYTVTVADHRQHQLTSTSATEHWPSWSPDGKRLVFTGDDLGTVDLFVMDARGGTATQLTHTAVAGAYLPNWH
jgi:TolB protein